MKNAKLIAETETNVCTVRVYYDIDPSNYYMTCEGGKANRFFGPFKKDYLENLVDTLKDVKEMKGRHYFIDAPPLIEMLDKSIGSISPTLVEIIKELVPLNGTILELGSGEGTAALAGYFSLISVEHNSEWLDKYKSTYIHAPLVPHKPVGGFEESESIWYDPEVLRKSLPHQYDLILVDGPPKNRSGFIKYFDIFKNVPIVFDDVNRTSDYRIMVKIAARLSRPFTVYAAHEAKHFGVIIP